MELSILNKKGIIVQPNKVTMAITNHNNTQQDVLTLVIERIQKYLITKQHIQTDLFLNPIIKIDTHKIAHKKNKTSVIKEIVKMCKEGVCFNYKDLNNCEKELYAPLFISVENIKKTKFVDITINEYTIPYLVYWGKEVGGTFFQTKTALQLSGTYTKTLYKFCCMWRKKGKKTLTISLFRKFLCIKDKYARLSDIKKFILNPARESLKNTADIYFDYEFKTKDDSKNTTHINFNITSKTAKRYDKKTLQDQYLTIHRFLRCAYDDRTSLNYADQFMAHPESLKSIHEKFTRLNAKDKEHLANCVRKIINEDFT